VRLLVTGVVVTVVLGVALAATGTPGNTGPPAGSIYTDGPVVRLAVDGTIVAAVVGSKSSACGAQIVIWNVRRETPTVIGMKSDCAPSELSHDAPTIAVGGGMVGVIRFAGDHAWESMLSVTELPPDGGWINITGVYDYEYGAGEGDYLSILGDGPILAFDKWSVCVVNDPSHKCPGVPEGGGWWVSNGQLIEVRAPGSKGPRTPCPRLSGQDNGQGIPWSLSPVKACRSIGRGAGFYRAVALDRGRFLVVPPLGRVAIVSAKSGRVTELPIQASAVAQADLDGTNLVVLRKRSSGPVLEARDASNGALRRTWPLSRVRIKNNTVWLEDAQFGIVVYRIGTTLHVLRLTDGKSHIIPIPADQGPVHARLEDAGLTYSFSIPGSVPRGRIEFVPFAHLLAQLH